MKKRAVIVCAIMSVHLLALLSLSVVGIVMVEVTYASPYTSIDVDTAYNMITNGSFPDLVVLDVRTPSEYNSGYINGAVWIPLTELESRIDELAGHENHEIIIYCNCPPSASASEEAAILLDSHNFTKVFDIVAETGAITEWQAKGYPIVPEFPSILILPTFMIATLLAVVVFRRKTFA